MGQHWNRLLLAADVSILASKLVSYGDKFPLRAPCPKCSQIKEFALSIRAVLEQTTSLPPEHTVRLNDDLVAYLRPYTFDDNNRINLFTFEQTKRMQNLSENVTQEEASAVMSDAFQKITRLHFDLLAHCVIKIVTPKAEVTDYKLIKEFIDNSSRDVNRALRNGIDKLNTFGLPRDVEVTCDNDKCKNEWRTPVVYDPASFFVSDS
jgi:hypothetical protein